MQAMYGNVSGNAMMFSVTLTTDPFLPDGIDWLYKARDVYNAVSVATGLTIGTTKGAAYMIDTGRTGLRTHILVFVSLSYHGHSVTPFVSIVTLYP